MSRILKILLLVVAIILTPILWFIYITIWQVGWPYGEVVVVSVWTYVTDFPRFASLQPYASELTLLPAPATFVASYQNPHSGIIGDSYGLNRERDYTFKTVQSPQSVFSFYNSQLTRRGWKEDDYSDSPPFTESDNADTVMWQRPGTNSDTLFYSVAYYFGSGTPVNDLYPNLLALTIESDPNNKLGK
jgi:hypothetical protein